MRIRYSRQALLDLEAIADYVREQRPSAAINIEQSIRSTIGLLGDFPMLGRFRPELNVRMLGIPRHPYTAYYSLEGDEVWIVHIRDDRRAAPQSGDM